MGSDRLRLPFILGGSRFLTGSNAGVGISFSLGERSIVASFLCFLHRKFTRFGATFGQIDALFLETRQKHASEVACLFLQGGRTHAEGIRGLPSYEIGARTRLRPPTL